MVYLTCMRLFVCLFVCLFAGILCVQVDKGGEDAFFICHHLGMGAIGVADGVSGWAEEGVDPAEYSRSLMRCVG
jgi:hypothetical protein